MRRSEVVSSSSDSSIHALFHAISSSIPQYGKFTLSRHVNMQSSSRHSYRHSCVYLFPSNPLTHTNFETTGFFSRRYDQHGATVLSPAHELTTDSLPVKAIQQDFIKYCVDNEFLKLRIVLQSIHDAKRYAALIDEQVLIFLKNWDKNSKRMGNADQLNKMVEHKLPTNKVNMISEPHMEDLFKDYYKVLTQNKHACVINETPRVAVQEDFSLSVLKHFMVVSVQTKILVSKTSVKT